MSTSRNSAVKVDDKESVAQVASVSAGDRVEVGQTLLTYDLEFVKEKAKDIITPCVVTNMDSVANIEVLKLNESVDFSQEVAKVKLKID